MLHRIILSVHRNATDNQIQRFLRILEDSETVSHAVHVEYPDDRRFTPDESKAREKVWNASRKNEGVALSKAEAAALWSSILQDSVMRVR